MEQTIKLEMTKDEATQLNAAIEECLRVLDESNERSEQRWAEINRLQADTRALLNRIGAILHVERNLQPLR